MGPWSLSVDSKRSPWFSVTRKGSHRSQAPTPGVTCRGSAQSDSPNRGLNHDGITVSKDLASPDTKAQVDNAELVRIHALPKLLRDVITEFGEPDDIALLEDIQAMPAIFDDLAETHRQLEERYKQEYAKALNECSVRYQKLKGRMEARPSGVRREILLVLLDDQIDCF